MGQPNAEGSEGGRGAKGLGANVGLWSREARGWNMRLGWFGPTTWMSEKHISSGPSAFQVPIHGQCSSTVAWALVLGGGRGCSGFPPGVSPDTSAVRSEEAAPHGTFCMGTRPMPRCA